MKTQVIDKNGFPKPLGIAFILTVVGIFCFILFLSGFSLPNNTYKTVNKKTKKSEYSGNQKMESGEEQNGSVVTEEEAEQNEETKENKFSEANFSTALDFILKEAVEEKILIEEWMYDESFWSSAKKAEVVKNELFEEEEDEEIKIEPWMYEEKYWPSGKKTEKKN